MELSEERRKTYITRLLKSRMRILINHGFYGLLLMHMEYTLEPEIETAATDGNIIMFNPDFLESLSEKEVDFVMMHEILHVVLRHCKRYGSRNRLLFNAACDIVVNSNILFSNMADLSSITLGKYGVLMHETPSGEEGYKYTAEEVYEMLLKSVNEFSMPGFGGRGSRGSEHLDNQENFWDNHSRWGMIQDESENALWAYHVWTASESAKSRGEKNTVPPCIRRALADMIKSCLDWKTILNDFIQEEITDYSFLPPDRRFSESPFLLPDYNDKEDYAENVLFMIDTSGSMSDKEVTEVYQEVMNAVDQFGGRLSGLLGFFDHDLYPPVPFKSVNDIKSILPKGGGGTDLHAIFRYIDENMLDIELAAVIIMTDGYAEFPDEESTHGVPVLWIINNERITPPWGKVVRIERI